jgi:hypothetical protein
MVMAMFMAHLVGDYVLQWDKLAAWKSRELKGVIAHGVVVFLVTGLFVLLFDPGWWRGVLFISLTHFLIDAMQLYVKPPMPPLARFMLDQLAHVAIIVIALVAGGYLELSRLTDQLTALSQSERLMILLLGYIFISMPAWVIVKFAAYGLVHRSAPEFPGRTNKYREILERFLITTFTLLGQFWLIPLVVIPRLLREWPEVAAGRRYAIYLVELLASVGLALSVGLILRQIQ